MSRAVTRAVLGAALGAALLGVGGCRIEPTGGDAPSDVSGDSLVVARVVPDSRRGEPLIEAPVVAPSGLAIPVAGIRPGDLVDTFDDARSEGRIHDAIDIMAPRGTPVVSAAPGTVARLFASERGGLTVYVQDGRTVYYYAHLDAYAAGLAAGQTVGRGDALGTVGSTGNASPDGPHLHFAVWIAPSADRFWEGENVNPYPLLTGR